MRLYLDSANIEQMKPLFRWGAFAGVTTNPIILAREGLTVEDAAKRLTEEFPGDVFVQLDGVDADDLEKRIRMITSLNHSRIMVKIPPTPLGLEVIHRLRDERIWTAATALFTPAQALLAANAGADILIPFYSRIEQTGTDAREVVREMVELCTRRGGRPRVLAASLKSIEQLLAVARVGAWGATIPVDLASRMIEHEATQSALARFAEAANGRSRENAEE